MLSSSNSGVPDISLLWMSKGTIPDDSILGESKGEILEVGKGEIPDGSTLGKPKGNTLGTVFDFARLETTAEQSCEKWKLTKEKLESLLLDFGQK